MLRATVEESPQDLEEFRLIEQEGVVTLVAFDLDERHIGRRRVERAFPRAVFTWPDVAGGGDVLVVQREQLPG